MLTRMLAAVGWISSAQRSRPKFKTSRCPLVERLEDRSLMTAVANLVAYRPITDYIDYSLHAIPDAVETDPKLGPGIRVNGDDDNGNGCVDYLDNVNVGCAAGPSNDNDLVQVIPVGEGSSIAVSWTGDLAVWTNSLKDTAVANGGQVTANQPLWVEYVSQNHTSGSSTSLLLTASDSASSTTATDSVVFHSFQSIVIAIGGNSQDPSDFGDPRLGVYTMAGSLYDQGYDVHLYAHSQINSNGSGAAYDEVVGAVLNRNVDNVAIYGYSWGGGATYELSYGLSRNTALAPAGYQLVYTAYVDAIRHYSLSAETRKPVGTQYHDNFDQRKDWLLKGNAVSGANNVNVTLTSWGKKLVHTTIDDNATLQDILISNLKSMVIFA